MKLLILVLRMMNGRCLEMRAMYGFRLTLDLFLLLSRQPFNTSTRAVASHVILCSSFRDILVTSRDVSTKKETTTMQLAALVFSFPDNAHISHVVILLKPLQCSRRPSLAHFILHKPLDSISMASLCSSEFFLNMT